MAVSEIPVVTYTDVTGVIDATADGEVAALLVLFKALIPDPSVPASGTGTAPTSPDFGDIPPATCARLRTEFDALAAAIAAAPTV